MENRVKAAYARHRWDARKRGISFEFTIEEWVQWWETELGPDWQTKRGPRTGQYVMARYGDRGPYAPHNVRAVTVEHNHAEYNVLRKVPKGKQRERIDAKVVLKIFNEQLPYDEIAKKYKVGTHQVHCIKTGKYYGKITGKSRNRGTKL